MEKKFKMDTRNESFRIEMLDFLRIIKLKNIVEVIFFLNFKMEDKFKMAASTIV
jgi:hypothetical protein